MSKVKTNRGAAKRFKKTGSGQYKRKAAGLRHILTKRTTKQKKRLLSKRHVNASDVEAVREMVG